MTAHNRTIGALLSGIGCAATLAIGLAASTPAFAQDEHRNIDNHRYYDRNHKDYHRWDENEERNYGVFLNENHIQVHVFRKARPDEQQRYWIWRHNHPDERR